MDRYKTAVKFGEDFYQKKAETSNFEIYGQVDRDEVEEHVERSEFYKVRKMINES